MTESVVAYARAGNARDAARELCAEIKRGFRDQNPDALVLFASARYDQDELLREIHALCSPRVLVGASSAGEFTAEVRGDGLACALALRSSTLRFSAGIGRRIREDRARAARDMVASFQGLASNEHHYRSALVMTDALAGHADDLVDQLTLATSGRYQFFGGGAGDDALFQRTQVFCGQEAVSDAAVALEILSHKPLGIGVGHGWEPAGPKMRVTEARGMRLVSLNGLPAAEAFERHAAVIGARFDRRDPIPFFLHNIIGIDTGDGHRLRVPLAVMEDGSVDCASEVPAGSTVHIMRTTNESAVTAAARAVAIAREGLHGNEPQVALFFDCVATRLRMGELFSMELGAITSSLGGTPLVGCNTHGQIARADGQFGGFHNCTAVVCLLPG